MSETRCSRSIWVARPQGRAHHRDGIGARILAPAVASLRGSGRALAAVTQAAQQADPGRSRSIAGFGSPACWTPNRVSSATATPNLLLPPTSDARPARAAIGRPVVVIDNDANCAALAEHHAGAARARASRSRSRSARRGLWHRHRRTRVQGCVRRCGRDSDTCRSAAQALLRLRCGGLRRAMASVRARFARAHAKPGSMSRTPPRRVRVQRPARGGPDREHGGSPGTHARGSDAAVESGDHRPWGGGVSQAGGRKLFAPLRARSSAYTLRFAFPAPADWCRPRSASGGCDRCGPAAWQAMAAPALE
jgi:hypothetical protein